MRRLSIETPAGAWHADLDGVRDLSIGLAFDGAQPNLFEAPAAASSALRSGDFIGDVSLGGSCNCSEYRLTPHCNGTHTECVGHLTRQRVSVRDVYRGGIETALLISVPPTPAEESDEDSDPRPRYRDSLVTAAALRDSWQRWNTKPVSALIVRTLPNDPDKANRRYGASPVAPYLTRQAVCLIVERGILHLLLDVPSLDRTYDEGKLTGHRLFWGLPAGSDDVTAARRAEATLTEMIFAPDDAADGYYLLDLQVAPFQADAAPSRPLLYPLLQA